ncbi:MAG: DNA-formamidopyrimidine glycosylase [Chlamydiae bacterium]|nr:DNA-formamidopyrimidine glycosylase [Chlamydiota bacterium]
MPELPEVETIVRELNHSDLIGKKILRAEVFWYKTIAIPQVSEFLQAIENQKILKITRQGKYIVFHLSLGYLFVHLRMTGKFLFTLPCKHERVRLFLDDGRILYYADQRKFGRFSLSKTLDLMENIGIDPFSKEFTLEFLRSLLCSHSRQIKPFLLDQKYIAGLGNIYVDEALWEAKIHPERLSNTLSERQIQELYAAIPKVLEKGIKNLGTSLGAHRSNYYSVSGRKGGNQYKLNVFRRDGEPCARCGEMIIKVKVAQRGTHICPNCQS